MRTLVPGAWAVLAVAIGAQGADARAFEVVSVRRTASGDTAPSSIVQPGGRYSAANMTLRRSNLDECGGVAKPFPRAADARESGARRTV